MLGTMAVPGAWGDSPAWAAAKPFVNAGVAASLGITVMNPVDVVKTRLQIAGGGSPVAMARSMVAQHGVSSLYAGLTAQYLRAWTFQAGRLGAYRRLVEALAEPGRPPPLRLKAVAGLASGALGAIVGMPSEVALIRMQAAARVSHTRLLLSNAGRHGGARLHLGASRGGQLRQVALGGRPGWPPGGDPNCPIAWVVRKVGFHVGGPGPGCGRKPVQRTVSGLSVSIASLARKPAMGCTNCGRGLPPKLFQGGLSL